MAGRVHSILAREEAFKEESTIPSIPINHCCLLGSTIPNEKYTLVLGICISVQLCEEYA